MSDLTAAARAGSAARADASILARERPMDGMHKQIRRQLEDQLDRLARRVGRIEGDLRTSHDPDWTERAIEVENDPVLEGLDASGRLELASIRSALARLDEGTYGTCSKCGKPIDARRLQAMPMATTCLACAS